MSTIPFTMPGTSLLTRPTRQNRTLWFGLSLAIMTLYGLMALHQAFDGRYVVQDDARQHIFWMQRYLDPTLFPEDLIADYFQSAAPIGYAALYKAMAMIGMTPAFFSKILPFFLGLLSVGYGFYLSLEIFPVPISGFISSVILSQTLWGSDELSSGTPRAFLYPLLMAFLYAVLRRDRLSCLLLLVLQAAFYPPLLLISVGLIALRLVHWKGRRFGLSKQWQDYGVLMAGLGLVLALALYTRGLSDFGPLVTRAQAVAMPEFQPGARNAFFLPGILYWVSGYPHRSGLFHIKIFIPAIMLAGLFLPLLLRQKKPGLRSQVTSNISIFGQLVIVSLALFWLAHLLLFELHLPSRYTSHTLRLVLVLAAGIFWTIFLEDVFSARRAWKQAAASQGPKSRTQWLQLTSQVVPPAVTTLFAMVLLFYYPLFLDTFPKAAYRTLDRAQPIYEFLAAQPKGIKVASLSQQADNIPTFTARSVLFSQEHALAYHTGYYAQIRARIEAVLQAQYAEDPAVLAATIQTYDIDFWLVDAEAFRPDYIADNKWLQQFQPIATTAQARLEQGAIPVLQQAIPGCTVLNAAGWLILEGNCVRQFAAQPADAASGTGDDGPSVTRRL